MPSSRPRVRADRCHGDGLSRRDSRHGGRASAENIERLRAAFRDLYGPDPHIHEIAAADVLGEYSVVRYYPPTGDSYFDVVTRLGDAVRFESLAAERKEFDGVGVSVATPAAPLSNEKG